MTRRWVIAGVLFGVLWLFVRGVELTVDAVLGQFLLGTAVGLPVAFVFRRLFEDEVDLVDLLRSIPYVMTYLLVFLREVLVANLDVAYRVLAPNAPIEPQVILVPLRVETAVGVTTIANSITITPGTITRDHDPDQNALYVHVIDGRDIDAVVEPIREWEDYALEIFNEAASPDDPAPEIIVHPPEMRPPEDRPPEPKRASAGGKQYDSGGTDDGR